MYNTGDHEIIIVPNNDMVNKKVVNYSRPDRHRSMSCEIGVAYGTDLNKVKRSLLDVAMEHPDVIKEDGQMPYVRLARFSASSVDYKLWYWVDIKNMWRVASEVRQAVYDRFNKEGIEIPFPQSVVTFKNGVPQE
jgi:small-conductance mechanosensitive channel